MRFKPRVYFTSDVFTPEQLGSNEKIDATIRTTLKTLWKTLNSIAIVNFFEGRFPTPPELSQELQKYHPNIIGCHISQPISPELLKGHDVFAIATATMGYNHISPLLFENILITHTPGILHETVADYTIALIMSNLRNLIDLHNYVWEGNWSKEDRWDLDQDLSSIITSKTIGIVGLGEIGTELVKKLSPWNITMMYYDIHRKPEIERSYSNVSFQPDLSVIFRDADIVSLHIPLNKSTEKLINHDLLTLMKPNSLLINTARGNVLDLDALLDLLKEKKVKINFAIDVFPQEPISDTTLKKIKQIKREQPDLRIILMPHNASADANTRGNMVILFLKDIIKLIQSYSIDDLKDVHIIPEQKSNLMTNDWNIKAYWNRKNIEANS
ncbi:MAG: 2-hydroxyacid dehydrogenase [Candidatus Hermodarchaeota archaeon]